MQSGTNGNGCCREAKRKNLFYLQQDFQAEIPVYSHLRANFNFGEWATTETNISLKLHQEDQQNAMQISLYRGSSKSHSRLYNNSVFSGRAGGGGGGSLFKKNCISKLVSHLNSI
jgi:hypothetical protein